MGNLVEAAKEGRSAWDVPLSGVCILVGFSLLFDAMVDGDELSVALSLALLLLLIPLAVSDIMVRDARKARK